MTDLLWESPGALSVGLAVFGSSGLVAVGFAAWRSLLLRFEVKSGGVALTAALTSLAFIADFGGRAAHDLRVGVAACVCVWGLMFGLGARALALRVDKTSVAIGAALALLVASVALTTSLWDEANGHGPLTFAAATGVLPIEHPSVLNLQFPYHVAFDILAAVFVVVGVGPIGAGLDLATMMTTAALLWCLFDVGVALGGRRVGQLTMVTGLLSHGPLSVFGSAIFSLAVPSLPGFSDPELAPPPTVSVLLQHPLGFSMSVALAVFLLATSERLAARVLSLVVLAMLPQVNIATFVVVFFGSAFTCLRRPRLGAFVAAYIVVGLFALATSPFAGAGGHVEVGGFFGSIEKTLLGVVVFFPAVILAAPLAYISRDSISPLMRGLLFACAVGFIIGNFLHYAHSWDIVKFLSIAAFFAVVGVTALSASPGRWAATARLVLLTGVTVGLLWALRFGVLNGPVFPRYDERREPFSLLAARAITPHLGPYDCVVTIDVRLAEVGIRVGGLDPVAHPQWAFNRRWAEEQHKLWRAASEGNRDAIREMGCRFAFMPDVNGVPALAEVTYEGARWTLFSTE